MKLVLFDLDDTLLSGDTEGEWVNYMLGQGMVKDDSFLEHSQFNLFEQRILKFGYNDVKKAIFEEVPSILELEFVKKYFDILENMPFYIFLY